MLFDEGIALKFNIWVKGLQELRHFKWEDWSKIQNKNLKEVGLRSE